MPSPTYFGATLTNLGPVVTPFTPAPSCTNTQNLAVAIPSDDGFGIVGYPDCDFITVAGCVPYGSQLQDMYHTALSDYEATLAVYSPGLVCPSGWTTAGTIVGPSGWASASGAFSSHPFRYTKTEESLFNFPRVIDAVEQYVGALEKSETLAWCCPSGMHPMRQGYGCVSSLFPVSEYSSYSGLCFAEYGRVDGYRTVSSYKGSLYTEGVLSPVSLTKTVFPTSTSYETYYDDEDLVMMSVAHPVMLIHKEEDKKLNGSSTAKTSGNGKGEQGDDKSGDDDESGARRLMPTSEEIWSIAPVAVAAGSVFVAMIML